MDNRYNVLVNKATSCLAVAYKCWRNGKKSMSNIWMSKYVQLKQMAWLERSI